MLPFSLPSLPTTTPSSHGTAFITPLQCRVRVVSRRSLRLDPSFDEIIRAVYPDPDAVEAQEVSLIESIDQRKLQDFKESMKAGYKRQQAMLKRAPPGEPGFWTPSQIARAPHMAHVSGLAAAKQIQAAANMTVPGGGIAGGVQEVQFYLLPHPSEQSLKPLKYNYLKTSAALTVFELSQFVCLKLKVNDKNALHLLSPVGLDGSGNGGNTRYSIIAVSVALALAPAPYCVIPHRLN